ncbi:GtrA family protein [Pseudomonas sp. C 49-2]|jgi:putative flippase GtrA|uniref:Polysaccharide biosynthesis protein GtrA n=2 Tax=Pseudomonas canadensis TaxID=915099 RepID=A0A423FFK6_9PSED|nr:polysaccharide biosynthesis protein GtrA [Pseudomonas canadensis]RTX99454.1 GtrA family protein [Pseudomonas sp. C 49-2]
MMTFNELIKVKFLRFLLVGLMNAAFGYGCFAGFIYLGLHYSFALLLATVLGVAFNFKSTGSLVFGSHDNKLIVRFVLGYAVVYGVNLGGVAALALFGVVPYVSGLILLLPMAVLSFLINNRFVFNDA